MKQILAIIILSLIPLQSFSQEKIAVIDVEFLIQNSTDGKKAKKQMEKLIKKANSEKETAYQALMDEKKKIEKKAPLLTPEAKAKHSIDLERKIMAFQKKNYENEQILSEKENKLTADILSKIEKIVATYSKEKSIDLVFENVRGSVIYSTEKKNITDDILAIYNKKHK